MQEIVHGPWTVDAKTSLQMKSQDIVLLFKLISLDLQAKGERVKKREFTITRDFDEAMLLAPKEPQAYVDHTITEQTLDGCSTEDDATFMLLRS